MEGKVLSWRSPGRMISLSEIMSFTSYQIMTEKERSILELIFKQISSGVQSFRNDVNENVEGGKGRAYVKNRNEGHSSHIEQTNSDVVQLQNQSPETESIQSVPVVAGVPTQGCSPDVGMPYKDSNVIPFAQGNNVPNVGAQYSNSTIPSVPRNSGMENYKNNQAA